MDDKAVKSVCNINECTACGSCINICPKKCISYVSMVSGTSYASIDTAKCISCSLCQKVCPNLNVAILYKPITCYAAWSNDNKIKRNSASGGIATELYRFVLNTGGCVAGVSMDDDFNAEYHIVDNPSDFTQFQNSKYVYSDTLDVFKRIGSCLRQGKKVLFIGLPCQVAGLRQYLLMIKAPLEGFYAIDLVCHGVTPSEFLKDHIKYLEKKYKQKASKIYFRDPYTYTYTFTLCLINNNKRFYQRGVYRDDVYQIGYHSGISYRDNCYQCHYARPERTGDLTLADFSYVGKYAPCAYDNKNVSCILCNTDKGRELINILSDKKAAFMEERPLAEEMDTEKQLRHPTIVPVERLSFLKNLQDGDGFEMAMRKAVWKKIIKNEVAHCLHYEDAKRLISRYFPKKLKKSVKKIIYNKR